mmetsp:Transcript_102774/g.276002  ORF Transcript_102774/g.276002 Transcript_102774/m.276002 type:complete len:407 (-) Transcript_102774:63-1283(-)
MGVPEVAAAASCFSLVGSALGLHLGLVACFAGCVAGVGIASRRTKRGLAPALNRANAASWAWMAEPVVPLFRTVRGGAAEPWARAPVHGPVDEPEPTISPNSVFTIGSLGGWSSTPPRSSSFLSPAPSAASSPQLPTLLPRPCAFASPSPMCLFRSSSSPGSSSKRGSPERPVRGGWQPRRRFSAPEALIGPRASAGASPPSEGGVGARTSGDGGDGDGQGGEGKRPPQGIVLEWSPDVVESLGIGQLVSAYLVNEACNWRRPLNWLHPLCWVLGLFERQLCIFLDDAFDGQVVPLVIPICLPEGMYSSIQTWLPEIRVMLVLWLRFSDRRWVTSIKVAVVDGMIDQIANVVKSQCIPPDLRDTDPRLRDFTEPIDAKFEVALRWSAESRLHLQFNDFSMRLGLPR